MSTGWKQNLTSYAVAIAAPLVSLIVSSALQPIVEGAPFIFFFVAVAVSAGFGGLGPGLLTTLLSMILSDYFILNPSHSFSVAPKELVLLGVFFLVGLSISLISNIRKRAEENMRQSADLLDQTYDANFVWKPGNVILNWYGGAEKLYGWTRAEAQGRVARELLRTKNSLQWTEIEHTLQSSGHWEGELEHVTRDGRSIIVDSRMKLVTNRDGSQAVFETNRDITAQKQSQANQQFLIEASKVLSASLEFETILKALTELAVPAIADWCSVDLLGDDGLVHTLAVKHIDPDKVAGVHELRRKYPVDPNAAHGTYEVIRTGKSILLTDIPDEMLVRTARDAEHLRLKRELGLRSAIEVPLIVADHTLGVFNLVTAESGRHYGPADLTLAEDLARRAAVAVEHARLYQLVRQAQERLQVTLTSIGDAVIATDNTGRITFLNPVAQAMTGWRESEAIGSNVERVFAIVNESTRQTVESPVTKVLRDGMIVGLANHTVLIARDGREIPIDDSGAPIKDESGTIIGVILVFRDISERMRLEKAKEDLTAQVQQAATRAIRLQDITAAFSGALTLANIASIVVNAARSAVGADAATLVRLIDHQTLEIIDAANLDESVLRSWQRFPLDTPSALPDAVKSAMPLWIESRDQWIERYGSPPVVADHNAWALLPLIINGQPIGGISLNFREAHSFSDADIIFMAALAAQCAQAMDRALVYEAEQSARKEAEKAKQRLEFLAKASRLLASSLEYDVTFKNLKDLILPDLADIYAVEVVQPDQSIRRITMASVDPSAEHMLRELASRSDSRIILNSPSFSAGQSYLFETIPPGLFERNAQDAEHLALIQQFNVTSEMIIPLRLRDVTIGILTLVRRGVSPAYTPDDLILAEELAQRATQAIDNARLFAESIQAVSLRDEFLSVAAHELKTPVTSMRGFAQILLRQLDKRGTVDPIRLEQAVRTIDAQSAKLNKLISQLLDVSRIEAGRLALEPQQVDMVALTQGAVSQIQANTRQHNISLNSPPSLPCSVDPVRMEQVIVNLLDNAVKYSPDGGSIEVAMSALDHSGVTITVRDHGLGIPPDRRPQLFNRFYQAHGDGHLGGMGLGLYISKQIVEQHGGTLEAIFPADGGTCFVITLPCAS